ncbi:PLP-dependent transferase [Mesorhizobium cantuariense]|uniref:PLP-dependent transferase n=1 Tax=Mesorhizobium cantuariense TaxID=1300275 RepID=A0ABV7MFK0_9HYPH
MTAPFEPGADAVLHSATKDIGGHSDLMAGVPSSEVLPFAQHCP